MRSLGSAAAQGGQDTFPEHENGSPLTGWDASVQASRDASYHASLRALSESDRNSIPMRVTGVVCCKNVIPIGL